MEAQFAENGVVIVGGGIAGLSAACYLVRAGVAVTLFEKASGLGGRAATQNYEGYCFNRGIHGFYTGGAASEVFQELAITYSYGIPKDIFTLQQGKIYPSPVDTPALLHSKLLDLGDKLEFIRLFATLPRINPQTLAHMSVQEWIEQTVRRPQLRRFMAATACTFLYSTALDVVSADVFVEKLQRFLKHPIHYIDGGWQTLVNTLRQTAEQAGARIVSDTRVEAVEHHNGSVQGIRLRDGSVVPASAVIIATSPNEAVKLVDEGAYPALRQTLNTFVPAQVACLDVALSKLPDTRHPVIQDMEHPLFLSTQSVYSRIAPQGGAMIYTFKQLDPVHPTNPREDERELENFLDTVQPGWRDVLVKRNYLPRIEAVGTLPLASNGGFAGRPGPRIPGLANVYLVGDWIGPEGFLIDASMSSARLVARLLLQNGMLARENSVVATH
jgi:phytoene dehydrogenase-like protein